MDFTAIGSGVNIASRLESANRHFKTQNLASITFCGDLDKKINKREIGRVVLKGLTKPLQIFELIPEEEAGEWVTDWGNAWENWHSGNRGEAIKIWREILSQTFEDEALENLIQRLEPFVEQNGENDDVVILGTK